MLNLPVRARLPLGRYPLIDTTSLDEASAIYSTIAPLRLQNMANHGPFSWRINCLALGAIAIAATDNSAYVRAKFEGASDAYLLSIPLGDTSAESTSGKSVAPVARGKSACLDSPWQDLEVRSGAGFQGLQVRMPRRAVIEAMTTLMGGEAREVPLQRQFALDSMHAVPFMQLLDRVVHEADQERPAFSDSGASERAAEALLFRFLLGQPQARSMLLSRNAQPAEPRYVRRAAEYLDMHSQRHITMAELTRVTGVSARSLQLGFVRYRGASPLEFVRERRLERARVLLLTSDVADTVSEAARMAGIEHLGRFSVRYRARFGESPRRTLARRWR